MRPCSCRPGIIRCAECGGVVRAAKKPKRLHRPVAPGRSKRERNANRKARMAEIRRVVVERQHYRCAVKGCGNPAVELHHLLSGPLRRQNESVDTCVALCRGHHDDAHRGVVSVLQDLMTYCDDCGMLAARAALAHRLMKIYEAQRAQRKEASNG